MPDQPFLQVEGIYDLQKKRTEYRLWELGH
jgi:hypothetical protein